MPEQPDCQAVVDREHLKLLSWGYYVSAGIIALYSLVMAAWLLMAGAFILPAIAAAQKSSGSDAQIPAGIVAIIGGIGLLVLAAVLTIALLKFLAGRYLARRKSKTFCMIIAALSCLEFPYGTLLGVLTFMVLGRASVAKMFERAAATSRR